MKFPLRIVPFRSSSRGEITSYVIRDAEGRGISVHCESDPLRRDVAKLWTPEEAEALAKKIARFLTDERQEQIDIDLKQEQILREKSQR